MEYKELLDVSNIIVATLSKSMTRMGLSGDFIVTQMAEEFGSADIRELVIHAAGDITSETVDGVLEEYATIMDELMAVQEFEVLEKTESQIKLKLKHCAFATVSTIIRDGDKTKIPPCPWIALLTSALNRQTESKAYIESSEWDEDTNTCLMTISL
ncbi:MAG: hypothetical protein BAJATHORv1_10229 [Candidatus Thorarchaeota archaeon]|nr:MAG: hypothetical protein BAJATHORv1_10229 [Candidatus Thorarchaeota archaeon]